MGNLFCKTDDNGKNATTGSPDPDFHHGSSTRLSEDNHETEAWNTVTNKKLNKLRNKKQSEASESELSSNARAPDKHIAADSVKPHWHPGLYKTRIQTKTKTTKQPSQNNNKTKITKNKNHRKHQKNNDQAKNKNMSTN